MCPDTCPGLDDYLAGDLAGEDRARFVAHLSDCAACRRAVREGKRLDALLRDATVELECAPAGLTGRVRHTLRVTRRRRAAVTLTALAASVAAFWWFGRPTPPPAEPSPPLARQEAGPLIPRPADPTHVSFPGGAKVAAVRLPSESPNVTILWLFPDRRPTRQLTQPDDGPSPSLERNAR